MLLLPATFFLFLSANLKHLEDVSCIAITMIHIRHTERSEASEIQEVVQTQ